MARFVAAPTARSVFLATGTAVKPPRLNIASVDIFPFTLKVTLKGFSYVYHAFFWVLVKIYPMLDLAGVSLSG